MYEEAIALQPSFVAAQINAGILYAERKKFTEAQDAFETALRYDPDNVRAQAALEHLEVYQ